MNALTPVFAALCIFALAYRFHGLAIAKHVLELKPERTPPPIALADRHDKTDRYVLFGHHFAVVPE